MPRKGKKEGAGLEEYGRFTKTILGAAVNIALALNPINLFSELLLGDGFIPIYGHPVFASGLAAFLSIFVVLPLYVERERIFGLWLRPRILRNMNILSSELGVRHVFANFWMNFVFAFGVGIGFLFLYVWLAPVEAVGVFLYAGAFVGFTATFHLPAIVLFMRQETEVPRGRSVDVVKKVLERGMNQVRLVIGDEWKIICEFHSRDERVWYYSISASRRSDGTSHMYLAVISRKDGELLDLSEMKQIK